MKRILSFLTIITIISFCLVSHSEKDRFSYFDGVYWNDTMETIQELFGKGDVLDSGHKAIIRYANVPFFDFDNVDYNFCFTDNKLKAIWFLASYSPSNGDPTTSLIQALTDIYGSPIRTNYDNISSGTFTDVNDGNHYLWFPDSSTMLYLDCNPGIVHIRMEEYISDAQEQ